MRAMMTRGLMAAVTTLTLLTGPALAQPGDNTGVTGIASIDRALATLTSKPEATLVALAGSSSVCRGLAHETNAGPEWMIAGVLIHTVKTKELAVAADKGYLSVRDPLIAALLPVLKKTLASPTGMKAVGEAAKAAFPACLKSYDDSTIRYMEPVLRAYASAGQTYKNVVTTNHPDADIAKLLEQAETPVLESCEYDHDPLMSEEVAKAFFCRRAADSPQTVGDYGTLAKAGHDMILREMEQRGIGVGVVVAN